MSDFFFGAHRYPTVEYGRYARSFMVAAALLGAIFSPLARAQDSVAPSVARVAASAPQDAKPVKIWNVQGVMSEVLRQHPSVRGSALDSQAASKQVDSAILQFFPTPSISSQSDEKNQVVQTMRLTQPLWTGGQLSAQLRSAQLRQDRSFAVDSDVRIKLALKVLDLCQAYALNSRRVKVQQWTVDTLVQLTEMIARRSEAEVSSMADLRVAQSRLAQAQSDLFSVRALQQQAQSQLSQMLGTPVDLRGLEWSPPNMPLRALEDYLDQARIDWPANRVARLDALLAEQEVATAQAGLWPNLSLSVERQTSPDPIVGGSYETHKSYVALQYSMGAGLSQVSQADAAQLRANSSAQAVDTAERLSADALVSEWQSYHSAAARQQYQQDALQGAQETLASSRRLFIAGKRSWLDVVNSVRDVTQSELSNADIETVLVSSRFRLELLAGQPVWVLTEEFSR